MEVYKLILEFKTGDVVPTIREFENLVNKFMGGFGFSEKIFFQSKSPCIRLTSNRLLTQEEQGIIFRTVNENFTKEKSPFSCVGIEYAGSENISRIT